MTKHLTLADPLRRRAQQQPDRVAYTFLPDGEAEGESLTYGELDRRARAIGARLQAMTVPGERVLLLYPPGLEYIAAFFGCLYAGAVAVPAYPPKQSRNLLRLQSIVADAQATVALTTETILARIAPSFSQNPYLEPLRWLTHDAATQTGAEDGWQAPAINDESLALLQYTSGSTATPKGVMLSHGNLLHNERMIQEAFRQRSESVVVGWLPLYHDMGLIGNVIQPMFTGARCVLMSPIAFLQRPLRWLQAISRYRGTTSGGPNFAYDLCVRKINDEQRSELDLGSWSVAFNGSEPVRAETLGRFADAFGPCGFRREAFRPCYGLAEATLLVSAGANWGPPVTRTVRTEAFEEGRVVEAEADAPDARTFVSCGAATPEQRVVVARPEDGTPCAPCEVGEIWVSGASVARGYWNRPDETERSFGARLAQTGEGPFLRTGDLGFLLGGELYIAGRLKDLIVIRGRNHYPQDIELTVEQSHAALRPGCGAAFSVEEAGEECLVVVHEVEHRRRARHDDLNAVVEAVRRAVAENHDLQASAVVLVQPGSIPKTSSGKIQRHACRAAFLERSLETLAERRATPTAAAEGEAGVESPAPPLQHDRAAIEGWLQAHLAARLGLDPQRISLDEPIVRYGLDSLTAVELMHGIEARLGVALPFTLLLQSPSVAQLAGTIVEQLKDASARADVNIPARADDTSAAEYPLSRGQQALWFLQKAVPESAAYNIVGALRVLSELDGEALRQAFQTLIDRHPSLRTTFNVVEGSPVQTVHEHQEVFFQQTDASAWTDEFLNARLSEKAYRPFDLERGPLLRVSVFGRSAREHVLLVVVHHIVADFWSLAVIIEELGVLYDAARTRTPATLAPQRLRYADFVRWQEEMLQSATGARQWDYWRKQLAGELPVLKLPADRPRPPVHTYRGAAELLTLDESLTAPLKQLAREHGATLYMVLLAAFKVFLHRYTQQTDIIVGSPTAGRSWSELAGLVGYFANPVALRSGVSGEQRFDAFLREVRQTVLDAFEHQDYPFPALVERLQPARDAGRTPLFQVAFVFQKSRLGQGEKTAALALGEAGTRFNLVGLEAESVALEQRIAQFDLTLTLAELDGKLVASWQYSIDLFDAATVRRMAACFETLLHGVAADASQRLSELPLLGAEAERQLLAAHSDAHADHPQDKCLHQLFAEQAARTPDAVALTFDGASMTYGELDRRADQVARYLRGRGAGPESPVGLMVGRSPDLVAGLLGILKAGAAYVPLDPSYPQERLRFMADDAGLKLVLTRSAEAKALDGGAAELISIDQFADEIGRHGGERADDGGATPDNLAYVIYTSGSTGRPKGVAVTHANVGRLFDAARRCYDFGPDDVWTLFHSAAFDFSVWELWGALLYGGRLVVVPYTVSRSPSEFLKLLRRERVTILNQTPSAFRQLSAAEAEHATGGGEALALREVIFGGEGLELQSLRGWFARHGDARPRLVNMYGITETTVHVTFRPLAAADLDAGVGSVIGEGLADLRVYVLDGRMRPVPEGVAGELYVGGAGLARGYLGRAALTAERFVPDPFSGTPGTRMYRTGDVARRTCGGELEYLGRIDGQVKVRGHRIELGEVEVALAGHKAVRECAVVVREDAPGDKRLVAYVVAARHHGGGETMGQTPTAAELRGRMKERLPDYMVPSAFVFLDGLPLTPNGKLDRKALPAPAQTRDGLERTFVAPRTEAEKVLAEIWSEVLRVERVGVHDNFFGLGGDSILSIQITARANRVGLRLTAPQLFQHQTVAELAATTEWGEVAQAANETAAGPVPLTPIQHWFFEGQPTDPHHFNQAVLLKMRPAPAVESLRRAVEHLVAHHDALRLRFVRAEDGGWRQFYGGEEKHAIFSRVDLSALDAEAFARAVEERAGAEQGSLDLADGPLLRAVWFDAGAGRAGRLLLVIHHLAVDGVSWRILLEDLQKAYTQLGAGEEVDLGAKTGSYKQWAEGLRQRAASGALDEELDYWLELERRPVAPLPTDYAGGENTAAAARSVSVELSEAETRALLREVPAVYHTQINEVLLTSLLKAYESWCGERSLLVELEGHGREHLVDGVDTSRTVGWFTSLAPVVLTLGDAATLGDALMSVKEQVRRIPRRGVGYGVLRYLCGGGAGERLRSPAPAQMSFNYLGQLDQALTASSSFAFAVESSGPRRSPRATRRHLIEVDGRIAGGRLQVEWTYSENVHERRSVERLAAAFVEALRQIVARRGVPEQGYFTPSDFPLADLDQRKLSKLAALLERG